MRALRKLLYRVFRRPSLVVKVWLVGDAPAAREGGRVLTEASMPADLRMPERRYLLSALHGAVAHLYREFGPTQVEARSWRSSPRSLTADHLKEALRTTKKVARECMEDFRTTVDLLLHQSGAVSHPERARRLGTIDRERPSPRCRPIEELLWFFGLEESAVPPETAALMRREIEEAYLSAFRRPPNGEARELDVLKPEGG